MKLEKKKRRWRRSVLHPVKRQDLKHFKGQIITYEMCSAYMEQMLNTWDIWNMILLQDWKDLSVAVLEAGSQY